MKFRVLEKKGGRYRPLFYPQYKTFFRWKYIGRHYFVKTISNRNDDFTECKPYTLYLPQAIEIVKNFEKYLKSNQSYEIVHKL